MVQFADSSWAVLMLPPVLYRGEKLFQKASGLTIPSFLPAGMCRRVPAMSPQGHVLRFLTKLWACIPSSASAPFMPVKILPVPGQVMLSMAQPECVTALFSFFSYFFLSAVSVFPPTVSVMRGAAGSCGPTGGRVQVRSQKEAAELFWE